MHIDHRETLTTNKGHHTILRTTSISSILLLILQFIIQLRIRTPLYRIYFSRSHYGEVLDKPTYFRDSYGLTT